MTGLAIIFIIVLIVCVVLMITGKPHPPSKPNTANEMYLDRQKTHKAPPTANHITSPNQPPKHPWQVSENGNDTAIIGRQRVTVYPTGNSWKYAIASLSSECADPYFSDAYSTQEAARYEALAHANGTASHYQTKRQTREQNLSAALPSLLTKAKEDHDAIKKSVARQTANPKLSSLRNLLKRIESKSSASRRLYVEIYAEDKNLNDINDAKSLWESYVNLKERVEAVISDQEGRTHE